MFWNDLHYFVLFRIQAQKKLTIEDNFPMSDWIIVNLQQTGYYRVNYDENNWKLIQGHLRDEKRFSQIVPPNRAQIVVCFSLQPK